MSKYIDMITTANKTLTKKNEELTAQNRSLKDEIGLLKIDLHRLYRDNQILANQICENRQHCMALSPLLGNILSRVRSDY